MAGSSGLRADPLPPGVDPADSGRVHASFCGANLAPGMMDCLCAKIEDMLQRHRKELLDDILRRDELLFEKVRNGTNADTTSPRQSIRFSAQPQEEYPIAKTEVDTIQEPAARASVSSMLEMEADDEEKKAQARQVDAKDEEVEHEDDELAEQLANVSVGWRRRLLRFVASSEFELTFAVFIVTNSVFIGVQVDWASRNPGQTNPVVFYVLQQMYAAVFLMELIIRLLAEGSYFFCSSQWYWNYLDLFLVLASIFEVVTEMLAAFTSNGDASLQNVSNMRIIRIVRVARLMRIFRILRVVRFIRGLRTLLFSIICTLRSLVWAMLLLLIIIYVFGILFTQAVSDYLPEEHDAETSGYDLSSHETILRTYYGSLPTSMYTLFESVAGGVSWGDQTRALNDVHILCNVVFTIYVAFVYFAVLNVVTGVFCHAAIESAQADHDMVIQQQLANKNAYVKKVKQLFEDLDSDDSGTITLTEFESHFQDECVQAYFTSLDLDPKDAWTLFKFLDTNCSYQVDIEEFAMGCLRLRGGAKRIDIERLMYDQHRMLRGLSAFSSLVEHQLGIILGETTRLSTVSRAPQRTSIVAARDALQELKGLAVTAPSARHNDIALPPAIKKMSSTRSGSHSGSDALQELKDLAGTSPAARHNHIALPPKMTKTNSTRSGRGLPEMTKTNSTRSGRGNADTRKDANAMLSVDVGLVQSMRSIRSDDSYSCSLQSFAGDAKVGNACAHDLNGLCHSEETSAPTFPIFPRSEGGDGNHFQDLLPGASPAAGS